MVIAALLVWVYILRRRLRNRKRDKQRNPPAIEEKSEEPQELPGNKLTLRKNRPTFLNLNS
jgi:hypothetical protein